VVTRCRTYRYRLYPTGRQKALLSRLFRLQCELYNAALEERRGAWRWERRSVGYIDQCRTLTGLREVRPDTLSFGVTVCRGTLLRLERSFGAFYGRCGAGETPGFPRFKSVHRWDSVQYEDTSGWKLKGDTRRLHLLGIGAVKVHLHRPLAGSPKAITVSSKGRHYWVCIRCVEVPAQPLPKTGREVGIDLGVVSLLAASDGDLVPGERFGRRAGDKLASAQRSLANKKRGSNRRRRQVEQVAACHRRVADQRRDHLHKVSRQLVNDYDLIVHEDLKITNMVRKPRPRPKETGSFEPNGAAAKAGLDRSIHDAGWGVLLGLIAYKAEGAGREVISVDARHTSQTCSSCGHVSAGNRLSQAVFCCQACGHAADADVNAAVNILRAGRARQLSAVQG
jgi:putative transposase